MTILVCKNDFRATTATITTIICNPASLSCCSILPRLWFVKGQVLYLCPVWIEVIGSWVNTPASITLSRSSRWLKVVDPLFMGFMQ